jgi:hypothetical protein
MAERGPNLPYSRHEYTIMFQVSLNQQDLPHRLSSDHFTMTYDLQSSPFPDIPITSTNYTSSPSSMSHTESVLQQQQQVTAAAGAGGHVLAICAGGLHELHLGNGEQRRG